jgi:hypothetical protein
MNEKMTVHRPNTFNDAVSSSDYVVSSGGIIVNNELERMWRKLLSRNLTGLAEENHEEPQSISLSGFEPGTSCTHHRFSQLA